MLFRSTAPLQLPFLTIDVALIQRLRHAVPQYSTFVFVIPDNRCRTKSAPDSCCPAVLQFVVVISDSRCRSKPAPESCCAAMPTAACGSPSIFLVPTYVPVRCVTDGGFWCVLGGTMVVLGGIWMVCMTYIHDTDGVLYVYAGVRGVSRDGLLVCRAAGCCAGRSKLLARRTISIHWL